MIRLTALALLLIGANAMAKTIDPTISGSWYNAAQSGHGLSVEYLDEDTTVIYWYVYMPDGRATFLVTAAQNQGMSASGTALIQEGMRFGDFDPNDLSQEEWGTVSVTYNSCSSMTLEYDSALSGYGSGVIEMQKLVSIEGVKCVDNPLWGNYRVELETTSPLDLAVGRLLILENGDTVFFGAGTDTFVGTGTSTQTSESQVRIEGQFYQPLTGRFGEPFSATGSLTTNGFQAASDQLNILGTRTDDFQLPLDTSDLQGAYEMRNNLDDSIAGNLSINAEGAVTGILFPDCQLGGTITSPVPRFSQIAVDIMTVSDCLSPNLQGVGLLLPDGSITVVGDTVTDGYVLTLEP